MKKSLMLVGFFVFSLILITLLSVASNKPVAKASAVKSVEYNKDQLVMQAVIGFIAPAGFSENPYDIDPDGKIHVLPGTGTITYNFRTGDSAVRIAGDHVEPAVTLYNPGASGSRESYESLGFNTLSCIGNKVRVLDGEAKGAIGVVVGKHGGAEHIMVDFPEPGVFDKLTVGDKMHVYAIGVGLAFKNVEGVTALNIGPELIEALTRAGMGVTEEGKLQIPIALKVPAKIMGSGLGREHSYRGDYDIQLFDEKTVREYGLEALRFGDLVGIIDADATYGRIFRTGAITVGVVTHSRSWIAGHGPGVTTLLTSRDGKIDLVIDPNANLAKLLKIRTD
jgi:hypothetical protein